MLNIVKVEWTDPCFAKSGWMDKSDFANFCDDPPARSISVGILAKKTKSYIVILQTIGENCVADAVKINRESIVRIDTISEIKVTLSE